MFSARNEKNSDFLENKKIEAVSQTASFWLTHNENKFLYFSLMFIINLGNSKRDL